jgi:uncharacterized protein (DUF2267 family)
MTGPSPSATAGVRRVEAVAMDDKVRVAALAAGAAALGVAAVAWHDRHSRGPASGQLNPSGHGRPVAGCGCARCTGRQQPSEGLARLLAAARRVGLDHDDGRTVARVTLVTFLSCLPPVERIRFLAVLPADVRRMAAWPSRRTWERREIHSGDQLVRAIAERCELDGTAKGEAVTTALLAVLRELSGPEAGAVSAALPLGLRPIWTGSASEGGFSLARRVWGETPLRGEWRWVQAPVPATPLPERPTLVPVR